MAKVVARTGINAIACGACIAINKVARKEIAFGTAFIPMTATEVAYVRCGNELDKEGPCSHHGHSVKITMIGYRPEPV